MVVNKLPKVQLFPWFGIDRQIIRHLRRKGDSTPHYDFKHTQYGFILGNLFRGTDICGKIRPNINLIYKPATNYEQIRKKYSLQKVTIICFIIQKKKSFENI